MGSPVESRRVSKPQFTRLGELGCAHTLKEMGDGKQVQIAERDGQFRR